jgi:hypothetical protein
MRKSQEWEDELQTVDVERIRLEQPRPLSTTIAERILGLAKKAEILYKLKILPNSVACWKRCYRTPRSTAELCVLLTVSHSTCSSAGTKQENGGVDGTRTL